MRHLIQGVRHAVTGQSWYAALGLALALPDICGWIDTPPVPGGQGNSRARYSRWFTANLQPIYTRQFRGDPQPHVFLTGDDCYALRCAFLHQGDFDITDQRAREALERFRFVVSPSGSSMHRNQNGTVLQLGVLEFCHEMCDAVDAWILMVTDPDCGLRLASLAQIEIVDLSSGFSV